MLLMIGMTLEGRERECRWMSRGQSGRRKQKRWKSAGQGFHCIFQRTLNGGRRDAFLLRLACVRSRLENGPADTAAAGIVVEYDVGDAGSGEVV